MSEATSRHPDWLAGADPSWFPRVLAVLQRDYPEIADAVWSQAIGDNAYEQVTRRTLPGHPVKEGAGYDCNCGGCLALPARKAEG